MTFRCMIVLAFAILGACGKPMHNSGFQSNGYSILNGGSSIPVINTQVRTGVVENQPVQIPTYTPSASLSESCHCFKTIVRPQIRNEFITVPTLDRIVRTVTSPIVETFTCNMPNQVSTQSGNMHSGGNNDGGLSKMFQSSNSNMNMNAMFGSSNGGSFSSGQTNNAFGGMSSINMGNHDMSHRQIVAQYTSNGGFPGSGSLFSSNSGCSNNGGVTTYILKTNHN